MGMKLGYWPKFQKLHMHSLSTPARWKLSLFSLYRQWFPRYGPIFKIATFGHETWPLAKFQKLQIYGTLFLSHGVETELMFTLLPAVSEIQGRFSKFPYLDKINLAIGQFSSRSCNPFIPQGVEIGLIFALRATVKEIKEFLTFITLIRYTN